MLVAVIAVHPQVESVSDRDGMVGRGSRRLDSQDAMTSGGTPLEYDSAVGGGMAWLQQLR